MRFFCKTSVPFAAVAAVLIFCSPVVADDERSASAAPSAGATEKKATDAEIAEKYRVPDGGVKELLAFVKHLLDIRATTPNDEYEANAFGPMKQAAEKIMEIATAKDRKLEGFEDAEGIAIYFRVSDGGDNPRNGKEPLSTEERQKLSSDLVAHLAAAEKPSQYALTAARLIPFHHERAGRVVAAQEAARAIGSELVIKKNTEAVAVGRRILNALPRLDLSGRTIEITGTVTNGSKFDWTKYGGKVVLVDFWATGCGACVAETPQLKNLYKRYRDRGFEIIGVSLDDDRAALDAYLVKNEIPWTNLHDGDEDHTRTAIRYGVSSLPTMILVGRDGKVITTNVRGEELTTLLEKEFPAE